MIIAALECQLETEHEERTMLLRERHELERKLADVEDRERCTRNSDQELVNRLRRDLKKTKILLHDARLMLQQVKSDAPNKAILRQLRNQVSAEIEVVTRWPSPWTRSQTIASFLHFSSLGRLGTSAHTYT